MKCFGGEAAATTQQTLDRADTKLHTHDERQRRQTAFRRLHGNMQPHLAIPTCDGHGKNEAAGTLVQDVGRENERGATPRLLAPTNRVEFGFLHVAANQI